MTKKSIRTLKLAMFALAVTAMLPACSGFTNQDRALLEKAVEDSAQAKASAMRAERAAARADKIYSHSLRK